MRRDLAGMLILAAFGWSAPALAEDQTQNSELPRLGLAPGEPQVRSAAPSVPFGIAPATSKEYVLDFHGYLLLPLRLGVHKRDDPAAGQSGTILHSPPVIPEDFRSFEYTGVLPDPWGQLNFTYGNRTLSGTMIFASRSFLDAAGYYNPVDQLGVTDAYINVNLAEPMHTPFEIKVGAITGRYGAMGAFAAGRYATPLIARTNSIGELVTAGFHFGKATLVLEQGMGGQVNRPARDMVSAGWNDYADPAVGASFVSHVHAGFGYADLIQVGLHYLTAWTQDDEGGNQTVPDGRISVMGADARLTAGRGGHLYVGVAHTTANNAEPVSGVIEILNARGGPELVNEYLGPNSRGIGTLTTFGAQYDLSLSRMLYGDQYHGKSADVLLSLFGIGTSVSSHDPAFDGMLKLKGGAEVTYNMLSWFGLSGRFDHVRANNDMNRQAYTIWTARILAHTGWMSRDEFALQYSNFTYGHDVFVKTGSPPAVDPTVHPDRHVLALSGTFWW